MMDVKITLRLFIVLAVCILHKSSAESAFFWHVTDFHYDPTYWTSQLSCNDVVPKPGMYGDYWCDSNWRLVEDSIFNMAAIKSDVAFVIWTGDSVAHIHDNETSLASNVEILQNITNSLKKVFDKNVRFLPSLGNHDFYPSDQADVKQHEMYNKTAQVWQDWITDEKELEQFVKGGFYTMELSPKLRLMSLNTNLYYTKNKITKNMKDPAGQFAWMKNVLEKARNDSEKVIVTAHVTPGVLTPNFVSWMYSDHHTSYVDILTEYHDVIVASHYGHDHSDGFKIIQDEKNDSQAVPQFVAPSVTPWRFRVGSLTGKPHNPGIRLVEFDKATGKHLNYVQYYINLTDSNENKETNWTKLYDFRKTYNVTDMSIQSIRTILDKMTPNNEVSKALAQAYCNNALVSSANKECTEKNRFEIVCGGKHYDLDEAKHCVDVMMAVGASSCVRIHLTCVIISLLMTIVVKFVS